MSISSITVDQWVSCTEYSDSIANTLSTAVHVIRANNNYIQTHGKRIACASCVCDLAFK